MKDRKEYARNLFSAGHNCAQSVLVSFKDMLDMDESTLKSIGSGFGGGMGRLQLTCGAVTGVFMVFSQYASQVTGSEEEAKDLAGEMIRLFEKQYVAKNGSITCRTILGVDLNTDEGQKEIREKNLHGTVCVEAVESAIEIAEEVIRKVQAPGYLT